jgi:hypothetical protein
MENLNFCDCDRFNHESNVVGHILMACKSHIFTGVRRYKLFIDLIRSFLENWPGVMRYPGVSLWEEKGATPPPISAPRSKENASDWSCHQAFSIVSDDPFQSVTPFFRVPLMIQAFHASPDE